MSQPFLAPSSEPRTYIGCCFCQAVKFSVELPSLESVIGCNCSYCSMKQMVYIRVTPDQLKIQKQPSELTRYSFGNGKNIVESCPICSNTFRMLLNGDENKVSINARLLNDLDIWAVERDPDCDDASKPPLYEAPKFAGPGFDEGASGEDQVTYYGSCHCGAVTTAFRTPALDKVKVVECNCSWCGRFGSVHCYPTSEQLHIGGVENLVEYHDNIYKREGSSLFCKHCASQLIIVAGSPAKGAEGPEGADGQPIEGAMQKLGHNWNVRALNIRCLHGVDFGKLKTVKFNGRDNPPVYPID